jgi:3-deoxy-7-phosphoheptulonate synthase
VGETHSSLVALIDPRATADERDRIVAAAARLRPGVRLTDGDGWSALALGEGTDVEATSIRNLPGVVRLVPVSTPYRIASLDVFGSRRAISISALPGSDHGATTCVGDDQPLMVMVACSGPDEGLRRLVPKIGRAGANLLFGGEFTPGFSRTRSDRERRLRAMRSLAVEHGLGLCLEVSDASTVEEASGTACLLQIGSRNMQDFRLLEAAGRVACPVLLKRGPGATLEEFLLAAEYVLLHGNGRVLFCESGIRTFDAVDRPRLEINALPLLRKATHLPVFADASGATRDNRLVPAVARACAAAGADGLVLEVATGAAGVDGAAVDIDAFGGLMDELRSVATATGRST